MRHNDANKTNAPSAPPLPFILRKLIVGWGEGVVKEGPGILHQIYKFRGGVNS